MSAEKLSKSSIDALEVKINTIDGNVDDIKTAQDNQALETSLAVPTADSTANAKMLDVIGNKNDKSFSNGNVYPSVIGHLMAAYYHVHDASRVYPRTDDNTPVAFLRVTASNTALTYGAWTEIAGYNSKTVMSDVHFIFVGIMSADDDYTLQLGIGATGSQVFWGECAFTRDGNQMRTGFAPIQGKPIPAGTKLWARLASTGGGEDYVEIKVYTHEYANVTGN